MQSRKVDELGRIVLPSEIRSGDWELKQEIHLTCR